MNLKYKLQLDLWEEGKKLQNIIKKNKKFKIKT